MHIKTHEPTKISVQNLANIVNQTYKKLVGHCLEEKQEGTSVQYVIPSPVHRADSYSVCLGCGDKNLHSARLSDLICVLQCVEIRAMLC